ncbi:MAG: right-handed parallel beta-helix repeat-containing protein [Clostridia bacterium]|nr:right-handed parallel beta-helix repeat-containing protein [Clostridia bacterium]
MFSKGREDYGEKNDYFEKHRGDDITWNLLRFPVINANYRKNVTVAGSGWIDAGGLGWHERRGLMFSNCDGVCVKDVTLINFPEWTLITYVSANIDISDCRIFGYKSNSDGFAICNSKNARITDCFARSGDDLFEIKTLGGPAGSVADNVVFTSCTAWASKARCFGIIAETEFPVSNITFRDCYVIYRDSTWDNEFLGSLMVYCELSKNGVTIDNILFENIEIFYDRGRAINVKMEDDKAPTQVTNVTFRNVRYRSELKNLLYNPSGIRTGNYVQEITLENVTANGKLIGPGDDLGKLFDMTGSGEISVVRNEV